MFQKIKILLRSNPYTANAYKKLYQDKKLFIAKQRNMALRIYGKMALKKIQKCIDKSDAITFFDMGTALGLVRDGCLLKHDLDIDVGIVSDDEKCVDEFCESLVRQGFQLKYCCKVKSLGVIEKSFIWKNIKVDVSFYHNEADKSICYLLYKHPDDDKNNDIYYVVQLTVPEINATQKIPAIGSHFSVPAFPERYLESRYGMNWRTPDRNYVYWNGPSTSRTNHEGEIIIESSHS